MVLPSLRLHDVAGRSVLHAATGASACYGLKTFCQMMYVLTHINVMLSVPDFVGRQRIGKCTDEHRREGDKNQADELTVLRPPDRAASLGTDHLNTWTPARNLRSYASAVSNSEVRGVAG
jgi:hypothetical protein